MPSSPPPEASNPESQEIWESGSSLYNPSPSPEAQARYQAREEARSPTVDEEHYEFYSPPSPRSPQYSPVSPGSYWPDEADDSLHQSWKDHVTELPFLSNPRPRAITPSECRNGDPRGHMLKSPALYQNSPWFRVPPAVRQDILRQVFGDRRLHMSLSYLMEHKHGGNYFTSWHWFGSICSRGESENDGVQSNGRKFPNIWDDYCKKISENIGIMGWLLSCRQNYRETIELLYSRNTISMSGQAMIPHINQLLLPQSLAAITSLEIRWPLEEPVPIEHDPREHTRLGYNPQKPYRLNDGQFSVALDALSTANFPNLRKLIMSFEEDFLWRYVVRPQSHEWIIEKLCEFVKLRPKLDECAFALPNEIFRNFSNRVRTAAYDSASKRQSCSQVWCSLDGSLDNIRMPFLNSYPAPPFHLEDRDEVGFWLLRISEPHPLRIEST